MIRRATRGLAGLWHARPSRSEAALALAAGLAAASGQAPLGAWMLAAPALVGIVWQVGRAAGRGAVAAGWAGFLAGMGYFALSLHWIVFPFFVDPLRHGWMAPFALILLAAGMALFWAGAAALATRLPSAALGFGLLWGGAEVARGLVLTGFPWAQIGHIWIDSPLGQVPAAIGSDGLTLATALAAALPVALGRWAALVLIPVAVAGGAWTAARLALPEPPVRAASVVRLVQPNAEQHLKWAPDWAERNFRRLLDLTARPAPGAAPDLIVWPETAVPYLVVPGEDVAQAMTAAAGGTPLAAGIQRIEGARGWNTLALFTAGGQIAAHFDKRHLVPFGEYIPWGDVLYDRFGLAAFASQAGAGYMPGTGPRAMDLGPALGRVLPLICYEAIFPAEAATDPAAGGRADWMLQITNDAWFGPWAGPHQHFAQARLRAIEQGLPLLRVANTGISAVIDARGRVTRAPDGTAHLLALGQAGVIDAPVPGALPPPPFARHGAAAAWFLWLCGLGLLLLAALWRRRA